MIRKTLEHLTTSVDDGVLAGSHLMYGILIQMKMKDNNKENRLMRRRGGAQVRNGEFGSQKAEGFETVRRRGEVHRWQCREVQDELQRVLQTGADGLQARGA